MDDPNSHAHSRSGGPNLPEGSSYFQEVMAELNPNSPPRSPVRSRRRSHAPSKHSRHGASPFRPKTDSVLLEEEEADEDKAEEEEERGKEVKEVKEGPERLILHGKCHCYFVENGNVTGLADHHCHHEHRTSPSPHTFHTPSSSPHLSRKATPTISPSSSPKVSRNVSPSQSPSCSPYVHRRITLTPSPENSPRTKSKLQIHRQQTSLFPPHIHLDEFRGRSHSDTAIMARLSRFRKTSGASTRTLPPASSTPHGDQTTPGLGAVPALRQVPRGEDSEDLTDHMSASLHLSPRRQGTSASLEFPSDSEGSSRNKLSPRAVSTEQLHYLYDQLLQGGSQHEK